MAWDEKETRFLGGPRPLGALMPRLTRPAFKRKSPAGAQIMADWPALVGPALAATTQPLRLAGGTLTLACSGPVAMELQHLGPQLAGRINAALGRVAVERFRFVQKAPAAPPRATRAGTAPIALPEEVESRLAGIASPELRAALASLGRGVYRNRG